MRKLLSSFPQIENRCDRSEGTCDDQTPSGQFEVIALLPYQCVSQEGPYTRFDQNIIGYQSSNLLTASPLTPRGMDEFYDR